MRKPSVLLVSYHFAPSPEVGAKRPTAMARYLADAGFEVTVLRGVPWSASRDAPAGVSPDRLISVVIPRRWVSEIWARLKSRPRDAEQAVAPASVPSESTPVARATAIPRKRRGPIEWLRRQVVAWESFLQRDKLWLLRTAMCAIARRPGRRFDVVVASGPPIGGYVCGLFAAWLWNASLVLDFRDPWYLHGEPERTTDAPGHPLCDLENRLGQYCVSRANRITIASPGIEGHIRRSFRLGDIPIDLIRNGYDPGMLIADPAPTGVLRMLYAGSLYWNRDPFPFLEAVANVCSDPAISRSRVKFALVGDCEQWGGRSLGAWIAARGLDDVVSLSPRVDSATLREIVKDSNVLINFAQGQPQQIPAKSYEYLASGREVLTLAEGNSDVRRLFGEAGSGTVVEPADAPAMEAAIRRYYRELVVEQKPVGPPRDLQRFERSAQFARLAGILTDMSAS